MKRSRNPDAMSHFLTGMNESSRLFRLLMLYGALLAGLTHMLFGILFYVNGIRTLAFMNVGSIMCYIIVYMLVYRRHITAGLYILVAEVFAHAVLVTTSIGWESSFHIHILLVLPLIVISRIRLWTGKVPLVSGIFLLYIWLDIRYRIAVPPHVLDPAAVSWLHTFNELTFMTFLVIIAGMYSRLVKHSEEELRNQAVTDPLTGLRNRRKMLEISASETSRHKRYGRPLSFVMCDIDHFKNINDTFGHDCGDEVIKTAAQVLMKGVRDLDHAFRWGGEEFLLMFPETPAASAKIAAERLRETVSSLEIKVRNISISLTMTFGISMMHNGESMDEAIDRADAALLVGKRAGRNCVEVAAGD